MNQVTKRAILSFLGSKCYDMKKEVLEELNEQYIRLRKCGIVSCVSLETPVGFYDIRNPAIICKILDLLIFESQKQLESEVDK